MKKYGVLILAAGASTRMGTSKQLIKIGEVSLLQKTISTALATHPYNCTVILGSDFERHHQEIRHLPIDIIENPNWENGMGSSIKAGIYHLKKFSIDAFHILVCDQPLLTSRHLKELQGRYETGDTTLVASGYQNTMGVPALFDWSLHSALLKIPDNGGAKSILMEKCNEVIDFANGATDLDTPENLQKFIDDFKENSRK